MSVGGKGGPSPGIPNMPDQDSLNRPEAKNLPRYAGQPGYPGTGPFQPRSDLGPDVGFGPGIPAPGTPAQPPRFNPMPTPMPMPGIPGGKNNPNDYAGISYESSDENGRPYIYSSGINGQPGTRSYLDQTGQPAQRTFDPINDPAVAYSDGTTPGGKSGPSPGFRQLGNFIRDLPPMQQPGMTSDTGFAMPGVPFGPAGTPIINQPVANRYTRTRTNTGNRYIPPNAPGR
jgi:hypothetical protein